MYSVTIGLTLGIACRKPTIWDKLIHFRGSKVTCTRLNIVKHLNHNNTNSSRDNYTGTDVDIPLFALPIMIQ